MTTREFTTAIMEHQKTLMSYSSRFSLDFEDRKDLVQETFTKAIVYKDKYKHDTNLRGWLCTIMSNTYINQYHRNVRLMNYKAAKSDLKQKSVFNQQSYESPEMYTRMNELYEQIEKLADELKTPLKKYLNGFKYKEIAEELGIPMGTVKHKIFKAREILTDRLSFKLPLKHVA